MTRIHGSTIDGTEDSRDKDWQGQFQPVYEVQDVPFC